MDLRKLLGNLDNISEGSMDSAKKKPTGPKFVGKMKGTDPAGAAKDKYVGSSMEESILKDLEKTLKEAPNRDIKEEYKRYTANWCNVCGQSPCNCTNISTHISQLDEVSADPRYLKAAERSRSVARDTQRQYWKSPEEKAAARRTELKRDAGIAGYSKRHRAANPDMYPTPKAQPAPKLRDPSTEYSDDYSTWAAGRRDTVEPGVAEGSLNEEAGNMIIRRLIAEFNEQMSGSPYYPLDYKNVGMRSWTRGDGSRYKDPGYIFIDRDLKPEDQPKWHKAKAIEKFWQFLSTKGARKIGDVSGEFGSDPHSPAVVLGKLIFVFNGRSIAWGSTSRLKNSSVWRQKQQGVAEESGSKVEAYGYVYNRRDQRVMWRKVFPSGEAAYQWADQHNATILGTRPYAQVNETKPEGFTDLEIAVMEGGHELMRETAPQPTQPTLGVDVNQQQKQQQQATQQQQQAAQQAAQKQKQEQAQLQKNVNSLKAAGAAVANPQQLATAFNKVDDQQKLNPADRNNIASAGTVLAPIMSNPALAGKFKDLVSQASTAEKQEQMKQQSQTNTAQQPQTAKPAQPTQPGQVK